MPMYAIAYMYEPELGKMGCGVSYRGSPTMGEDEARGSVFEWVAKQFPGCRVLGITVMEILRDDIEKAASWPEAARLPSATDTEEQSHG